MEQRFSQSVARPTNDMMHPSESSFPIFSRNSSLVVHQNEKKEKNKHKTTLFLNTVADFTCE